MRIESIFYRLPSSCELPKWYSEAIYRLYYHQDFHREAGMPAILSLQVDPE